MSLDDDKLIAEKQRQALRMNQPELRSFERQLRNEYIAKEQVCQIVENKFKKLQEEISQKREAECLNLKIQQEEEFIKTNSSKQETDKVIYSLELQSQIEEHEHHKQREMESLAEEKRRMDELIKKYHQDRERLLLEKKKKIESTLADMETNQQIKDVSIKKERLTNAEELRKIELAIKEQERRKLLLLEEIRLKRLKKEEIQQFLSANMRAQEAAIRERSDLIKELQDFEKNLSQNEESTNDRMRSRRGSISSILKTQIQTNIAREKSLKDTEKLYREQLKQNIQHLDEQDYNDKIIKEIEGIQYSIDLQNQISGNAQRKAQELDAIKAANDNIKRFNDEIEQKIAKEKQQMLKEYFPQ